MNKANHVGHGYSSFSVKDIPGKAQAGTIPIPKKAIRDVYEIGRADAWLGRTVIHLNHPYHNVLIK